MAMEEERRKLREIINHWNENRLDLFEISLPNEELEFHGVMRFYFQDKMSGNFATKCIRVSSTATTSDVVETLSEKFRPDIRMLTAPRYSLYEVHSSGEERRLGEHEKPLVVQLNWNKDDREGRFVLKNENDIAPVKKVERNGAGKAEKEGVMQNFKRTLSKKERKEKKRREREASRCEEDEENAADVGAAPQADSAGVAEEVYKEMPETSFTRTISNPEVVMKRRRQQKLERRLQEFHGDDGRPRSGGMLRVFADSLRPTIPYKTLLVSLSDPAEFVVREVLDKYGLEREDPANYCLARLVLPPDSDMMEEAVRREGLETALDDQDCPLNILVEWPAEDGVLVFQLRKKEDVAARRKKQQQQQHKGVVGKGGEGQEERRRGGGGGGGGDPAPGADSGSGHDAYGAAPPPDRLPYLVELSPDGSDSRDKPKMYRLQLNVTEVGSDTSSPQFIQLFGAGIQPQHCVVTNMEGVVTVTPSSVEADTFVQGRRISETTMLRSGCTLRFGRASVFKFVDPGHEPPGVSSSTGGVRRAAEGETEPARTAAVGVGSVPVPHETTFELDGDVHSNSDSHAKRQADGRSVMRPDRVEFTKSELRGQEKPSQIIDLPATLELREGAEEAFLAGVVNYTNSTTAHFKLSPTYALYLAARRTLGSPNTAGASSSSASSEEERLRRTVALVNRMVALMEAVIQEQSGMASALAFWMANASELLNFLKQDSELGRVTAEGQDVLANGVHTAFRHLVHCLQSDLNKCMPAFLEDPEEPSAQGPKIDDVLQTLSGAMSLLRRCRVNAALTIQLFSQLFHFVNMWLFNELARGAAARQPLCSYYWGVALHERLHAVEGWAERQGLELAADCHLSRIMQATTLLTMDKYAPKDVPEISSTCFKLNSLQLRALLEGYQGATGEPSIPRELIDSVVAVATSTADELAHSDMREVRLEEDPDLQLPFLLPEDGYSCDIVKGVPHGLAEFLAPLCQRGLCRLVPLPRSPGVWTVFFEGHDNDSGPLLPTDTGSLQHQVPKVLTVTLKKQHGLGLSIVAAKGAGLDKLGIYVKSVVKGGAADQDGRLAAGDQLLSVDGNSLVGLSQERAAELMTRTGSVVTLEIAKQGAIYHGLATLLNEPSPTTQHRGTDRRTGGKARPKSEGLELYRGAARPDSPEEPAETHTDAHQQQQQQLQQEQQQGAVTHGDDRLVKNRADHRSTPNVAHSPDSVGLRPVYPGAPASRVQSVSTGNLKAEESPSPPSLEAYPVPTATYAREYSTLPPPPADSSPAWAASSMQRAAHSEEELRRDRPYRAGGGPPPPPHHHHGQQQAQRQQQQQQPPPSLLSSSSASSSSHEHLAPSARAPQYGIAVGGAASAKTGPGRWKTPVVIGGAAPAKQQQGGLPPPPPPTRYPPGYGPESRDLPPPPPPPPPASALQGMGGMSGGGGGGTSSSLSSLSSPSLPSPGYGGEAGPDAERKREEQLRWYEAEKARLEEERERQRRRKAAGGAAAPGGGGGGAGAVVRAHDRPAVPPQGDTIIRELRPQSQPRTIERHDLHFLVPPPAPAGPGEEESASGSPQLSPSPWARDARERQEKQRQQQQLEMLEREIAALQSRPQHQLLPEESDRLRKLLLEREFQRRVQEVSLRRRGGDDDDDDDDDYEEREEEGGGGARIGAAGQKQAAQEKPLPWQHQQTGDFHQQQQQRHEEETRVLQAFPTLSVLHLLQDEERRKHQQQAEERARQQREAEERARQQREAEERLRLQREAEERARQQREAEERARQQREAEERARQQREAEERARQREAEERARQQREAEERARQREAEERAKQQREAEERTKQQREAEERTRKVEEQRRRDDDYYAHMEAERRRALDEEERRLLGPGNNNGDDDDGTSTAAYAATTAASPPAPSQQSKPRGGGGTGIGGIGGGGGDVLHRATLVRCGDGEEEADSAKTRDARTNPAAVAAPLRWQQQQQQQPGSGGGGGAVTTRRPPLARPPRPVSDGFALSSAAGGAAGLGRQAPSVAASSSMADLARVGGGGSVVGGAAVGAQQQRGAPGSLLLTYASPGNSQGMNTYRPGGTPGVIGSQEVYRDPRDRRTNQSKPEAGERPSPMPEKLPFRERQRLFSQGQDVANKIKTSRKLMELEQELGNK